jgi:hypothetical protein
MEAAGPWVALASAPWPRVRTTLALMFMLFHLCLGATLYVGTFASICMLAWVPFLPSQAWDALLRFAPTRRLAIVWRRMIDALAAGIQRLSGGGIPVAVRRIPCLGLGAAPTVMVTILTAYLVWVNLMMTVPTRLVRAAGPLGRLPSFKQAWGVMGVGLPHTTELIIHATRADGSSEVLYNSAQQNQGEGLRTLLWPPGSVRIINLHYRLMIQASGGEMQAMRNYCDWYRRQADAQTDFFRRVVRLEAVGVVRETPPMDSSLDVGPPVAGEALGPRVMRELLYSWPER